MSITLVAQRAFPYAGKTIAAGQTFEAYSDHDAMMLQRVGHAIQSSPTAHSVSYPSQNLTTASEAPVKPKRAYRRRAVTDQP